ncbi:MAG: hypothetical protein KH328_06285 [Staphylococcus sp.]|nr:hypothetical protein [Staphylococcus sp.]
MTSFDEIIDIALVKVDDYKIMKAYNQSQDVFKQYCDGFLINAIPNFFQCKQSLDYNVDKRKFISDLTNVEISILADFWVIEWFNREIQNSTKINALLQTSGSFKTHAASQNLKEKGAYIDALREKVYQKITDYLLQDININYLKKE